MPGLLRSDWGGLSVSSPLGEFIHGYWKSHSFDYMDLVGKLMSLLLNMLSRFIIGDGDGTLLQYSCLENPMDGGAW